MSNTNLSREMQSCSDCVFCMEFTEDRLTIRYLCNLGLDSIFHERNVEYSDVSGLGCKHLNIYPTTPCKARYTDEEMQKMLGV